MPKVEKLSVDDIYFGMSSFERTSRIDPSTTVSRTMLNARHVPYSGRVSCSTVAGGIDALAGDVSGVVLSSVAQNQQAISGIVLSNYSNSIATISGVVLSNYISNRDSKLGNAGVTGSGWRVDAGRTGWSGWRRLSISTAVSSILQVVVTPVTSYLSGVLYAPTLTSGMGSEFLTYSHSGHAFDLYRHFAVSGGPVTSGGISGCVSWMALGI